MNLPAALITVARKAASKPAIFWGEQQVNYGQLLAQSEALAEYLQSSLGVFPGQRIGLWLKNCPEFVPALFGVMSAGGVVVPINNFLKAQEVSHIIRDAAIELVITDSSMGEQAAALKQLHPELKFWQIER